MTSSRRTLTVLCVMVLLAAACGNSPSGDDAAPASDTAAPTTAAPAALEPDTPDTAEPATPDEAAGSEPEPDEPTEAAVPKPGIPDEAAESEPTDTEEPTTTEPEDPVVEEPVDPYPHRHDFVPLEGVPGVTDDEIRVAVIGTEKNNLLGNCILPCFTTGIQAYFDHVNDAGGVYGRDLVIGELLDDELGFNQQRSLEVIDGNNSLAAFQATLLPLGWGPLNDAGIPTFVWNIHGAEAVNRDAIFGHFVIGCAGCTQRGLPWLASQAGASRVGVLGYGTSEASKVNTQASAESIRLYSASVGGLEVAYVNDNLAFGLSNGIGPEVTQMIDAGVDFIATSMDINGMLTLAKELERQGVRDQITMLHPNSYDTAFVAEAGGLLDGDYVLVLFAPFEHDSASGLRHAYDQWVPAQGGPVAEQTMAGWINADLFVTGLLEAGPTFDRQAIIDSLNQITHGAGGLINPIDWSRQHTAVVPGVYDHRYASECVSYVRIEQGAFATFLPEPWVCWPGDTDDWSEPTPIDFAG